MVIAVDATVLLSNVGTLEQLHLKINELQLVVSDSFLQVFGIMSQYPFPIS